VCLVGEERKPLVQASRTMVVFLHRRVSWPQTCIEKVLFDVEYFSLRACISKKQATGGAPDRFLVGFRSIDY